METTVGFYGITHDGKGQSKRSPYHFKLGVYDFLKKNQVFSIKPADVGLC